MAKCIECGRWIDTEAGGYGFEGDYGQQGCKLSFGSVVHAEPAHSFICGGCILGDDKDNDRFIGKRLQRQRDIVRAAAKAGKEIAVARAAITEYFVEEIAKLDKNKGE